MGFSASNGEANVGLGMLSSAIARKGHNLKSLMGEVIQANPRLREMFARAEPLEKPHGWGLPIITPKRAIAGDGWALVGDAAGMIEPFTGKGIGPGMMSARICAEHIERALQSRNFNLRPYQEHMYRYYKGEIKTGYTLQKSLRYPAVLNAVIGLSNFSAVKRWSHQKMEREWRHWI
ncbi:MAG: hypothetical protein U5L96_17360 [Owenweeksia sp.]|nr:hypothetical protein [Owenweeksia sp.]